MLLINKTYLEGERERENKDMAVKMFVKVAAYFSKTPRLSTKEAKVTYCSQTPYSANLPATRIDQTKKTERST